MHTRWLCAYLDLRTFKKFWFLIWHKQIDQILIIRIHWKRLNGITLESAETDNIIQIIKIHVIRIWEKATYQLNTDQALKFVVGPLHNCPHKLIDNIISDYNKRLALFIFFLILKEQNSKLKQNCWLLLFSGYRLMLSLWDQGDLIAIFEW